MSGLDRSVKRALEGVSRDDLETRLHHREVENERFRQRVSRQRANARSLNRCVVEQARSITKLLDANAKHRPAYVTTPPPREESGGFMHTFLMLMIGVILGGFWREAITYIQGVFQ